MFSSIVLTTLIAAGTAHAAVAQGSWGVRADFSGCDSTTPLEVILDGADGQSSPAANITDFDISSPFDGNLVIKIAGAVGYGSPYPPQQVGIKVFADATGGDPGIWANATVKPGIGQPVPISNIYWNTRNDITLVPANNEEVSLETIFDGGSLVVTYYRVSENVG
ncbi:uncharacterized protein ColSpa_09708 [Colletotrichum spaethianum]|uniref:Uncharacterized protein n=1 Tax=Colletotrichum spaethianum TaxID=700344 RepID=A0AA37PC70_9PEZI|nr:uncharacterized protein ColSpa_09708 [Colletotrichum spaethianum]GKT49527.1 hypothetical protein ColSpa_09708 [Colletotrichum spaethianum]